MSDTTISNDADVTGRADTCVLASTATPAFADACELAAIALQDMREYDQALDSLTNIPPSATAMLTQGTRSGGTQELPASLRPDAVEDAQDPDTSDAQATKPVVSRKRLIAIGAAVVALVAIVAAAAFMPSLFGQPDAAAVAEVLKSNADFMDGFAANDYVEPSAYALSDVAITACEQDDDGSMIVDATAMLENASFESACTVSLKFARDGQQERYPDLQGADAGATGWVGAVLQATADTRAIAGVTVDPEFPEGFAPAFDDTAQTCTYTAEQSYEFWFGSNKVQTVYTYVFNGEAWTRSAGVPSAAVAYDSAAILGDYVPHAGDAASLEAFRITNFDAGSGAFAVEYRATAPGFVNDSVSGVFQCTLVQSDPTDATRAYQQTDGSIYAFSGEGSSSGGAGTASIEGSFGLDGTIFVALSIDYTHTPLLFGTPTDETMTLEGTLAHMS